MNFKTVFIRYISIVYVSLSAIPVHAQNQVLTLETCYQLARENYPLIRKQQLITETEQYSIANASKVYLPTLSFAGQATYQSETVHFPDALSSLSGISFPEISKDQYKVQGELNQLIFDGGLSKVRKDAARAQAETEQQSLEVNLYALKERITQIYFAILLMDEQIKQNDLRKADLENIAGKTRAALKNGTAYRSNVDELEAELTTAEMTDIELAANRKAYLQMLSLFTGKNISSSKELVMPAEQPVNSEIKRPELALFNAQKKTIGVQKEQLRTGYLPQVSAFFQGAYGRPTLNFLENKFGLWYIGGLRLNWNLGSLYTLSNKKHMLDISQQSLEADKETFLYNTRLSLIQQNSEIEKFRQLISKDEKTISLRASVKKSAQAQLDNGVITVRDYINYANAENQARQTLILHKIQLLQAQYHFNNISGTN
ncbi:TolC family protein [Pedobacter sp. BS3]|uniref:TolC family protein n=1 Tax=Pedobacter sp. BS3 TaxID=2567937 RepID=UPI0011EF6DD0|nr:TolC family protein [Pedobacter sp. BS3]TZF83699.1 TolC family protein [Pedobacter sp. BS3]